jgi:hypothetical protein
MVIRVIEGGKLLGLGLIYAVKSVRGIEHSIRRKTLTDSLSPL